VLDGDPGQELQVDTGWVGWLTLPLIDPRKRRRFRAWIFTAVRSRYRFVYPTFEETTARAIEACEAAWAFFGGRFHVLIPDNTKAIILEADPPEHTRTRAVLSQVLSPTALKQVRDRFAVAAAATVDQLLERRSFDAITDLAEAYPLAIFPDALGLRQEGRENLLPYAGVVFNAFGPPNKLRQDAIERSAPHQAYVAEQCQRENLTPGGFGA
jgi:cytochrome P450